MPCTRRAVLSGVALLASGAQVTRAAAPIRFATLPAMDFMAPVLAQGENLFAAQGLDVAVQLSTAAPSLLPAVVGGSLQLGVSTGIQVALAHQAGLDVVIVAGTTTISRDNLNTAIVVRPDETLHAPADFIGRIVVVPGINGSYHALFLRYLVEGGVDPARVRFIEGGFAQMPDLLRNKQVDAVLSAEPFLSRMVAAGAGRPLNYFGSDLGKVFTSFFIAQRSWVDAHPAALKGVRAAMRTAIANAEATPGPAMALIGATLKLPPDVMARQKPGAWQVDVAPADVQFWVDLALRLGLLHAPMDAGVLLA